MTVSLIYGYWPNRPLGVTWCDLPWALRDAGLPEALHKAGHDVVETAVYADGDDCEDVSGGFDLAGKIAEAVSEARTAGDFPVVLCGSCTVAAVGALGGGFTGAKSGEPGLGILWCDAHPDLHTPSTSTSGLLEGMALMTAAGGAWQAIAKERAGLIPADLAHVALFGTRDIDAAEEAVISGNAIPVVSDIDAVNARLSGSAATYVHLDMDVHDALKVRTNAFSVEGGPSVDEIRAVLAGCHRVAVMSVTGLDPAADDANAGLEVAIAHIVAVAERWQVGDSDA